MSKNWQEIAHEYYEDGRRTRRMKKAAKKVGKELGSAIRRLGEK